MFIPKCRRRTLYAQLRTYLGEVFRRLAAQKESRIEEGHLSDHVHMMISGYLKGKSAIHLARVYGERKRNFVGQHFCRDAEVIRAYIRNQEQEDERLDQLKLDC